MEYITTAFFDWFKKDVPVLKVAKLIDMNADIIVNPINMAVIIALFVRILSKYVQIPLFLAQELSIKMINAIRLTASSVLLGLAICIMFLNDKLEIISCFSSCNNDSDQNMSLITTGFHAYSRHPIYTGLIFVFTPLLALSSNSVWPFFVYGPLMWIILSKMVVPVEEEYLISLYGKEYESYQELTPRWL